MSGSRGELGDEGPQSKKLFPARPEEVGGVLELLGELGSMVLGDLESGLGGRASLCQHEPRVFLGGEHGLLCRLSDELESQSIGAPADPVSEGGELEPGGGVWGPEMGLIHDGISGDFPDVGDPHATSWGQGSGIRSARGTGFTGRTELGSIEELGISWTGRQRMLVAPGDLLDAFPGRTATSNMQEGSQIGVIRCRRAQSLMTSTPPLPEDGSLLQDLLFGRGIVQSSERIPEPDVVGPNLDSEGSLPRCPGAFPQREHHPAEVLKQPAEEGGPVLIRMEAYQSSEGDHHGIHPFGILLGQSETTESGVQVPPDLGELQDWRSSLGRQRLLQEGRDQRQSAWGRRSDPDGFAVGEMIQDPRMEQNDVPRVFPRGYGGNGQSLGSIQREVLQRVDRQIDPAGNQGLIELGREEIPPLSFPERRLENPVATGLDAREFDANTGDGRLDPAANLSALGQRERGPPGSESQRGATCPYGVSRRHDGRGWA